jgi:hypothetical protein
MIAKATSVDSFRAEVVPVITQKLSDTPLLSRKFPEKLEQQTRRFQERQR